MTAKSLATLQSDVATLINDNTSGDVSPSDVRTSVIDTIDSIGLQTVADVTALRALAGAANSYCRLTEYTSGSGVGGGLFYFNSAVAAADDGVVNFGNGTTIGWTRVRSDANYATPEMAGAFGDNSTDDQAALNRLGDYCRTTGEAIRALRTVTYLTTATIDWRDIHDIYTDAAEIKAHESLTSATCVRIGGTARIATFTASGDTMSATAHGFSDDDAVFVYTSAGDPPNGLTAGNSTVYYVVSSAANTFKLSATQGGAPITTTDAGTGTHWVALYNVLSHGNYALVVRRYQSGNWGFDDAGSVGIEVTNTQRSKFEIGALGFESGLQLYSQYFGAPITYNTFHIKLLYYNRRNLCLKTDRVNNDGTTSGWVNECVFIGGNWTGGTSTDGNSTRARAQILIDMDGNWGPSEHSFVSPSFEGDFDAIIECAPVSGAVTTGAANNIIRDAQWEVSSPPADQVFFKYTDPADAVNRTNTVTAFFKVISITGGTKSWSVSASSGAAARNRIRVEVPTPRSRFFCHMDLSGSYEGAADAIIMPKASPIYEWSSHTFTGTMRGAIVGGRIDMTGFSDKRCPVLYLQKTTGQAAFIVLSYIQEYFVYALNSGSTNISHTDVQMRRGVIGASNAYYGGETDWIWLSKDVQKFFIGPARHYESSVFINSFTLTETTGNVMWRLDMDPSYIAALPTADPSVTGALWNNSGVVTVS